MSFVFEEAGGKSSVLFVWKTVTILLMAVETVKVIGLSMLLVWHIYIWNLGVSTYQYLVEQEEMDIAKEKLKKGEITQEQYDKILKDLLSARNTKSVLKIKNSNVIMPV